MYDEEGNYLDPEVYAKKDSLLLSLHSHAEFSGLTLEEILNTLADFTHQITQKTESPRLSQRLDEVTMALEEAAFCAWEVTT